MDKNLKDRSWTKADKPTGCPNCGRLSFIRLRNQQGKVLGNSVVCADCKTPYELETGEGEDGK